MVEKQQKQQHAPGHVGKTQGPRPSRKQREPGKWLHHALKTVRKALKQAKVFEVRKITRRLAQAKKSAEPDSASAGAELLKLEQQLHAAKHADLELLVQQAACKAGLLEGSSENTTAALAETAAGAEGIDVAVAAAVHQRVLSAACVRQELSARASEYKRLFGDGTQGGSKRIKADTAAATSSPGAAAVAAADDDDITGDDDEDASGDAVGECSSEDLEAAFAAQQAAELEQQQQQEVVACGDGEQLDAATLAVLHKLRQRSELRQQQRGPDSDSDDVVLDDAELSAGGESDEQLQDVSSSEEGSGGSSGGSMGQDDGGQGEEEEQTARAGRGKKHQQQQLQPAAESAGPGSSKPTQQQQQLSKWEKLQHKKRAKLEKLLKRGKRVGQRMRRQLYEKLYGSEARHLQQGTAVSRRGGRGDKQAPAAEVTGIPPKSSSAGRQTHHNLKPKQQQQQQQPQQELHPSWIAKRQQQKQLLAAPAVAQKVVFGDDGQVAAVGEPKRRQQQQAKAQQQPSTKQQAQPRQRQHQHQSLQQQPLRQQQQPLHPSWQAKKQQAAVIIAQPTGKKVVFDD